MLQMYRSYLQNQENLKKGDFSQLNETHASSSALKCYVTITAAEGEAAEILKSA